MKTVIRFIPRNVLCTQGRFRFRLALLWAFTLMWLASVIFVGCYWSASWYVKVLVYVPLVLVTPDLHSLLMTYEKFQAMFVEEAKPCGSSEPCVAPNVGPTVPSGKSGITEGPPSVT